MMRLSVKFAPYSIGLVIYMAVAAEQASGWDTTEWVAQCLPVEGGGYSGCSPDAGFASDVLAQLSGSSAWLERLGYRAPAIERDTRVLELTRPWKVYVGGVDACGPASGKAACYSVDASLPGWPAQISTPGGELVTIPGLGLEAIKIGTLVRDNPRDNASAPTHELFHGIQAAYGLTTNKSDWLWFVEGSAAAIEAVHYKGGAGPTLADGSFDVGMDRFGNVLLSGRGYYDGSLDDLKNWINPNYHIYTSYLFWLFTGEALSPGNSPDGLRKLIEEIDAGGAPVASIDKALRQFGRGGLATYYPDFIAQRGDDYADYEHHVRSLAVVDGTDEDREDESDEVAVKRLGARFHLVSADPKSADDARLEIRIESSNTGDLHLIVDSGKYDGGTGSQGGEKNVFRVSLQEAREFKVRVANVADDAGRTVDQNYRLKVRLITEEPDCCSCDYSATKTFLPTGKFQCSFSYPANWEAQYDKWENVVYVKAPRCERRCEGARMMAVSISTGRDNNADQQEQDAQAGGAMVVGSVSCGGRSGPAIRPPGSSPGERAGKTNFHVGKNDGRAYDAWAQYSCPAPGEWQVLEKLLLGSFK